MLSHGLHKKPTRIPCLAISEIMTVMILFHQSPCKNFKYFYLSYLQNYTEEFPCLPSYNRFVELQQRCLGHFHALLMILCMLAQQTGINYIDATCVPVCHNKRTSRHKVFKGSVTPTEYESPVFKPFSESDFRGLFSEKSCISAVSKVFSA